MSNAPKYIVNTSRVLQHLGEANLTQKDVALAAGFSPNHLNRLISGSQSPSPRTRRRLMAAEVFAGLKFHDLFTQVQVGGDAR